MSAGYYGNTTLSIIYDFLYLTLSIDFLHNSVSLTFYYYSNRFLSTHPYNTQKSQDLDNCEYSKEELNQVLEQIKETSFFEICSKKLLRAQRKAEYSPVNIGHFALAVSPMIGYIQITSPIRRGPDLINHEIGKEIRHNPNFLIDEEKMEELGMLN